MDRKSKTITSPEREMIIRVMNFFEKEKQNGTFSFPVTNVVKRTSRATGTSVSTIKRIRRELEASKSSGTSVIKPTPVGRGNNNSKKKAICSKEMLNGLKNLMDSYIEANGKMMSLNDTLAAAKKHLNFPGQRETLRRVLVRQLGYVFENNYKNRKRKKKVQESTSESESDSDSGSSKLLENEYETYGTETVKKEYGDPVLLCEVKEENFT